MRRNLSEQPQAELQTDTPKVKAAEKPKAYTDPDYTVPDGEENDVHFQVSREVITKVTGSDGRPRTKVENPIETHILDVKMWNICRVHWPQQGYFFEKMLHAPAGVEHGFAK